LPLGRLQHLPAEVLAQLALRQGLQRGTERVEFVQELPGGRAAGEQLVHVGLLGGSQLAVQIGA
jgi:hypothetical protein